MGFRIVVDSGTDLTPAMRKDPCYVNVPLTIRCGDSTFVDDDTLDQADLLWTMKQNPEAPSTACPSPQDYIEAMDCGEEDVYVVTLSALLSGSHNSAEQARAILEEEKPHLNIHVFNSCSATAGQLLITLKIRELADQGLPFKKIVREIEQFIAEMYTIFVLENLDNLRKNGRLTKMQSIVTEALKIKLLCHATPEGEISKIGQALSIKQALGKMVDKIAGDVRHVGRTLVISHCNCLDRAFGVKEAVEKKCQFSNILIADTAGIATVYAYDGGIVCAY